MPRPATLSTILTCVLATFLLAPVRPAAGQTLNLRVLETRLVATAAKVVPTTVALRIGTIGGSGVIVTEDGYVMTAAHISGQPGRKAKVILHDGRQLDGTTLGANFGSDYGLVKIDEAGPFPFALRGKSADLVRGQWCLSAGHPEGYEEGRTPPVRLGRILQATNGRIDTDCTLMGGDSGGPLFDLDGRVIGIHSQIGQSLKDNKHIPVDRIQANWNRLARSDSWGGAPQPTATGRAFLGVGGSPTAQGAKIEQIGAGSPAQTAGLQVGDVLTQVDATAVTNFSQLGQFIGGKKPGDSIKLLLLRNGEQIERSVTLGRR